MRIIIVTAVDSADSRPDITAQDVCDLVCDDAQVLAGGCVVREGDHKAVAYQGADPLQPAVLEVNRSANDLALHMGRRGLEQLTESKRRLQPHLGTHLFNPLDRFVVGAHRHCSPPPIKRYGRRGFTWKLRPSSS